MIDTYYLANYVQRALAHDNLESPDRDKAQENYEVLISLYEAHQRGGPISAKTAWETIKRLRPNLIHLELFKEKLIHADELKTLAAPSYLSSRYPIYRDGFNVLFGPSASCKSFIALDIAGWQACNSPVVYIAGEGLHGYAPRWEAWKAHNERKTAQLFFYREALQVLDPSELEEFLELVKPHNPSLVVIDTLARSAIGIEENSSKEIGQVIAAGDFIRNSINCALLVVHHTGVNGKIRGSTALFSAADSVISVVREDGVISLYNDVEHGGKNKYAEPTPVRQLRLIPYPVGDLDGAVLVEAEQVIQGKEDKLSQNQREVIVFLHGFSDGQSAKVISEATDINIRTSYRALKKLAELGYVRHNENTDKYVVTAEGSNALKVL